MMMMMMMMTSEIASPINVKKRNDETRKKAKKRPKLFQ
jgi:hypothetical protein